MCAPNIVQYHTAAISAAQVMHLRATVYETGDTSTCIGYWHVCTGDLHARTVVNIENGEIGAIADEGWKKNCQERANMDRSPQNVPNLTETEMNPETRVFSIGLSQRISMQY